MKFETPWSEMTLSLKGMPRPYAIVIKESKERVKKSGKKIANKVPIPWQSFSRFDIGRALGVIKAHEDEVINKGVCAYCGMGFLIDERAVVWVNYPEKEQFKWGGRVFSDHFPFHIVCMKEVRSFCPHMNLTTNEEFIEGVYSELLKKSLKYYEETSTQLTRSSDHS